MKVLWVNWTESFVMSIPRTTLCSKELALVTSVQALTLNESLAESSCKKKQGKSQNCLLFPWELKCTAQVWVSHEDNNKKYTLYFCYLVERIRMVILCSLCSFFWWFVTLSLFLSFAECFCKNAVLISMMPCFVSLSFASLMFDTLWVQSLFLLSCHSLITWRVIIIISALVASNNN